MKAVVVIATGSIVGWVIAPDARLRLDSKPAYPIHDHELSASGFSPDSGEVNPAIAAIIYCPGCTMRQTGKNWAIMSNLKHVSECPQNPDAFHAGCVEAFKG